MPSRLHSKSGCVWNTLKFEDVFCKFAQYAILQSKYWLNKRDKQEKLINYSVSIDYRINKRDKQEKLINKFNIF